MKFLAILKDSYREAVSTWVVPVMLVLTGLLVVLIASVSFRPVTLQDELEQQFGVFNFLLGLDPANGRPEFVVENMTTSDEDHPWKADYSFDVAFRGAKPEFLERAKQNPGFPVTRKRLEMFLSGQAASFLNDVHAEDITGGSDDDAQGAVGGSVVGPARKATGQVEPRFHVTTKGTKIADVMSWPHRPRVLFFWDLPLTASLRDGLYTVEKRVVSDVGAWVVLLVSVVVTAGFIPNLLGKGSLDLYIAKPIGRVRLLLYKYVGGLTFVFLLTAVTAVSVWAVIGVRSGVWTPNFLAIVPLLTFYFAVLYAVSTLAAVLTRSTLVAILATILAWAVFFGVGWGHDKLQSFKEQEKKLVEKMAPKKADADDDEPPTPTRDERRQPWQVPGWLSVISDVLYYPSPRTYDLDDRIIRVISEGVLTDYEMKEKGFDRPLPPWGATLGVSAAFIAACLALASWRMVTRDG